MKKDILPRILALALCGALCGCANGPAVSELRPSQKEDASGAVLRLVDDSSESDNPAFARERPAISDASALTGGTDLQTVQTATIFDRLDDSGADPVVDEIRSVWISYLDLQGMLYQQPKEAFRKNIGAAFSKVREFGFNTVVVQVRPFGDALYKSAYFPWSASITGVEGQDPGFDPLNIMVAEAKARGLRIEAWLNPYRVRSEVSSTPLSAGNPAKKWLDSGDSAVIRYGQLVSYNPASGKARELIVNGAREIAENYAVDGIHIDDYFYPSTDAAFDAGSYAAYKNAGGTLALGDWRRSNVDTLIKSMYSAIKEANSRVLFGISPQGNLNNNYNGQFLDVKKIVTTPGYCDYICPQVYYGFRNESQPFEQVVKTWNDMITVPGLKLYVGIAAYKVGVRDNWAGVGADEWLNTTTQLRDMVTCSRAMESCGGFVIFRYEHIFGSAAVNGAQMEQELDNLKNIF